MARNIEIKARAREFDRLREQAAQLATEAPLFYASRISSTTCRAAG